MAIKMLLVLQVINDGKPAVVPAVAADLVAINAIVAVPQASVGVQSVQQAVSHPVG
jgi:hypothetical protein